VKTINRLRLIATLVFSSAIGFGQTGLATVTGTIYDATGAVVVNAPVTIRNLENGQVFKGASTEAGNYTISQLPVSDYDLTVTVTGFKTFAHTKFHLAAGQIMREDVTLEVGASSESVTVTADSSMLKTESSVVSQNVTLSQLNNLPVLSVGATNSGFRDPFSAARIVPGLRYTGGGPATTLVVNGTPANTFNALLDGATTTPLGAFNVGAQMQTQPSVDAIEEVAIQTSNFAAEYGTGGGAVITMVTKSGTNQYHGGVYDYAVNEVLNAHQPYTGNRNRVRQHDWGYTVGGPVWLPGLYDGKNKTFFFWSYEQFRNNQFNQTNNLTVPIPAYRAGDFSNLILQENRLVTRSQGGVSVPVVDGLGRNIQSGTIFDPATTRPGPDGKSIRDPFLNNKIDPARFDDISKKVLALVPLPLGPNSAVQAGNNYQGTYDASRRSSIPSIKFDHNLSPSQKLSFYYQDTHTKVPRTPTGADSFPLPITGAVASKSSGQTIRLNYDWTASATLLLHFGAAWNDQDFGTPADVRDYNALTELGLRGATRVAYFPRIQLQAEFAPTSTNLGGMTNLGQWLPARRMERRPAGNVSANYVTGSHTVKLGAEYRLEKYPTIQDFSGGAGVNGVWQFFSNYTEQPWLNGVPTNQGIDGFPFASFLLGGMSGNSLAAPVHYANHKSQTALYVQDTWKVTRKLTLDYGLRWDYGTYAHEQFGRNASLGLAIPNPSASGRLGALQYEATCKCQFADNYPYALGPRVGAAYQINSKTVLRAGFGIVYNATSVSAGTSAASASGPSLAGNNGLITGLFKDGMPAGINPVWPSFVPNQGQAVGNVIGMPQLLDANAGRPARLFQWNIGLQREITRDLVVEASYVGNRGAWWTATGLNTLNALSLDRIRSLGFNNLTSLAESQLLSTTVASMLNNPTQRQTLAQRGISGLPYPNFQTTQTVRQSLVDYPQYTGNGTAGSPLGKTWYDALQLSVTKRFSHGLQFNMNYTYSKSLDLMSATDVFNPSTGKNLSGSDRPHVLRITSNYTVPSPRNTGIPVLSNRIVSAIVADWGLGISLNYESAAVIGRPTSAGGVPINLFLGRGPGGAQLKKDANGEFMNPWSIDWVDYDGKHRTDPLDINCHCFDITKNQVLNPAAWENVPDGQFAAQQNSIRNYRGQRTPQENMNLSRNFRLAKDGKVQLNVRVEFTNVFNRMQFPAIGGGTVDSFRRSPVGDPRAGLVSAGFGAMLPYTGTAGQRSGLFVGRLTF
jgi:hypothetical protein